MSVLHPGANNHVSQAEEVMSIIAQTYGVPPCTKPSATATNLRIGYTLAVRFVFNDQPRVAQCICQLPSRSVDIG
jgi:hypothetical protein